MEPTWVLLNLLVCVACFAVCLCFVVLLPGVGQALVAIWSTVMGEQVASKVKGIPTGTDMDGINS